MAASKDTLCMLEFDDGEYHVVPFVQVEKYKIYHYMRHVCRRRRKKKGQSAEATATGAAETGMDNMCDVSSLSS